MSDIRFIKLKNGEDIIAYTTQNKKTVTVRRPVCIFIENFLDEGRQLLSIREWLPPNIVKVDSVEVPNEDIFCMLEVTEGFQEQYIDICTAFFDTVPTPKKKKEPSGEKVVSILEALVEKKDKPVH